MKSEYWPLACAPIVGLLDNYRWTHQRIAIAMPIYKHKQCDKATGARSVNR